jgi:4-amino-4-deoxy-L-arabinose transferase-like glycosyltransferase
MNRVTPPPTACAESAGPGDAPPLGACASRDAPKPDQRLNGSVEGGARLAVFRRRAALAGLFVIVTAYNLFKPFHIDDTAHLEIARWIGDHPLHPMSGLLNWGGTSEPISYTNQPHLYFAALALWGKLFGFAEPTMHALQSLASLASIVLVHRLARFVAPSAALWATALVILGPAFIVEQNLMVDVPLLATWLAFFNLVVCGAGERAQTRRFVLAGLVCAAAILIKYSSLTLLPIFAAALLVERRWAQAWTLLIPIGAIFGWSLFNYLDYGHVHMLARAHEAHPYPFRPLFSTASWCVGLGALTPLGVIAAVQGRASWRASGWLFYAAVGVAFGALALSVATGILADSLSDRVLMTVFAANAALMGWALLRQLGPWFAVRSWSGLRSLAVGPRFYLWLWLAGATLFYILVSPFIAPRHILLVIPPLTLLLAASWEGVLTRASKLFGLACVVVISTGLCISDWRFADFYRLEAARLGRARIPDGRSWASGHWGWQWYAERNGIPELDVKSSLLRPGDLVLVGREVDHQAVPQRYPLRLVRVDAESASLDSLICSARPARFYAFSYRQAPWSLSRACVGHLDIYRVLAPPASK